MESSLQGSASFPVAAGLTFPVGSRASVPVGSVQSAPASRLFPAVGPRPCPAKTIAAFVDAARGSLKLLAAAQLPPRLRAKVAPSDLVQNTALEACSSADRFEGTTKQELFAWLRQILHHNVLDTVRRYRGAQSRDVCRERRLWELADSERNDPSLVRDRAPHLSAIRLEEEEAIARAIASLPEPHATVIRLRIWEDLEFREIGLRCGRSEDAVRKIFCRSIRRLRDELSADEGDR